MCLPSLAGTVWGTELNSSKYLMKIKNIFVRFIFSGEQLLYPWISRSLISTNVLEIISLQMLSREHTSVMTRLLMWVFINTQRIELHSYLNISFPVCANSRQRFQDWRLQMHVQTRIWISFWGSYWLLWRTEVGCRVPEPGGGQTQLVRHVQMSSCWCLWPLILHHHHGVCCHPLHLPQTRPPQIEKKPETYSAVTHLRY